MKNLTYFIFILLGSIIFCGCDKEDEPTTTITLSIDSSSTGQISADGGTTKFMVKSNSDWEITKADEWVTVNPAKGSGDKEITVTATENTSGAERKAVITIKAGDKTDNITITQVEAGSPQPPVTLSIDSSSTQSIGAEGGTTKFTVKSNSTWEITKVDEWVSVNPTNGLGDKEIIVSATKNTTDAQRQAVITVKSTGKQEDITITQLKPEDPEPLPTLEVNELPGEVAAEGETVHFNIESNSDWVITKNSSDTWISATPLNGNGDARISIVVEPNDTESKRTAELTITVNETLSESVTITQVVGAKSEGVLYELDNQKQTLAQFEAAFESFTIIDKDGDGYNWAPYEHKNWDGTPTGYFGFSSESFLMFEGPLDPENYMILPELQLGEQGKIEVALCSADAYDYKETFKIVISSQPITSENCGEAEILLRETLTRGSFYEHEYSVDIPAEYNNGPVYIGVCHYESANEYVLVLSKICITHTY